MNILILGATGFIGSHLAVSLHAAGHAVTGLGRDIAKAAARFPQLRWVQADLASLGHEQDWQPIIDPFDVIINAAGALQDGLRDDLKAVQQDAMLALYTAARALPRPPLLVQISAPADLAAVSTAFMATKLSADRAVAASGLRHVILRPTVVIGRNAYGGTALVKALASMPFAVPLTGPDQPMNTVHIDDVAQAVKDAIDGHIPDGSDLVLAGGRTRTLAETVLAYRAWLGLRPAPILSIPASAARLATGLADLAGRFGWRSPLRSTAMAISGLGIDIPGGETASRSGADALALLSATPAGVQDLWFARLYLLKPLLIVTLSLFWLVSGLVPLFQTAATAAKFGPALPAGAALALTIATSFLDILLGAAVLWQPLARRAMGAMLLVSLAYLVSGTFLQPGLWGDPLGPLVKVIPSMVLTLAGMAIVEER